MNRIFFSILTFIVCIVVFSHCSIDEDYLMQEQAEEANFPAHIEKYGKTLAEELRQTVYNMNKMGVDYSDAINTPEFKERFYNDFYNAIPVKTRSNLSKEQIGLSPEAFAEGYRNLTTIQIDFIKRIIDEGQKTSSYGELFNVLININKDIYAQVPKIEQERLLYTTAVLYYGLSEIQHLEQQGQMLVTPIKSMLPIVKTRGESGGAFEGICTRFLTTTWAIAVGEPTPTGEIVASVITVIVGGILLYEVITCSDTSGSTGGSRYEYCQNKFENCYSPIPNGCGTCLQYCLTQGYWPTPSTH